MSGKSGSGLGRMASLKIFVAVALVMFIGGTAFYFYGVTVVRWWIPVAVATVVAAGLWRIVWPVWQRMLPEVPAPGRFGIHMVVAVICLTAAILGANRLGADKASARLIPVTVERKYQETRYRSRRVGRGRYAKGEPYKVYNVVYLFPDGREKTMEVSHGTYVRTAVNSTLSMEVSQGLFSWPVILRQGRGY